MYGMGVDQTGTTLHSDESKTRCTSFQWHERELATKERLSLNTKLKVSFPNEGR
jgi:hypothetical protein